MRAFLIGMCIGAIAMAGGGIAFSVGQAQAATTSPVTYQVQRNGQNLVLGPQSQPSLVLRSKPIPEGTYLVQAEVGVVMGPATGPGGQEGVVCAVGTTSPGDVVDSLFGGSGNGSSTSGTGPNGTYGSVDMIGTVRINAPGDHLVVHCNSTQGTQGTYTGQAQLLATRTNALLQG
jgi:hypothetical protein